MTHRIDISPLERGKFEVQVAEGEAVTTHTVSVPEGMLEDLGIADLDRETIVRESFVFLLEREAATSILQAFSLDQIARYFPEYTEELPRRLGR